MDSQPPPRPEEIAAIFAAVRAELASREWDSIEELEAHMGRFMARQNAAPQPDLGGLTPDELAQVLYGDWRGPGPLRVVRELPLAEIEAAPWFLVARTLMTLIQRHGPIKATQAGNLPRSVVRLFLDGILSTESRERFGDAGLGSINEQDMSVIHIPRVLLEISKLIRNKKGRFVLTREGRALLPDDRAGELYAVLFEACFRGLDLAYLDGAPEAPVFQQLIGYALVRLRDLAGEWIPARDVDERALHPGVRPEVPVPSPLWDPIETLVETRLLLPLERFGLVERREVPREPLKYPRDEVRKNPLYDRFLVDGRLRVMRG